MDSIKLQIANELKEKIDILYHFVTMQNLFLNTEVGYRINLTGKLLEDIRKVICDHIVEAEEFLNL